MRQFWSISAAAWQITPLPCSTQYMLNSIQRPAGPTPLCPASVPHSQRMAAKAKKATIAKIMRTLESWCCGSGDPELDDAVDPCEWLCASHPNQKALLADLMSVHARLEALDPTWSTRRSTPDTVFLTESSGPVELWVANWQTGYTKEHSVKGKSRSVRILACAEEFLNAPYCSIKNPLQLERPVSSASSDNLITPFSLRRSIGFSKSLCCKLSPLAVHHLNLTDDELSTVQAELQAVFVVQAIDECSTDVGQEVFKSIAGKMRESERQRPDVLQVARAFEARALREGQAYTAVVDAYLAEYNEMASGTQKISDLEQSVIKILPTQGAELINKLEYHWQN